ncbi:hypothetical protein [Streptomyces soliscabiei]|uniref:hypothetical protein n=1 Tax=Streptomyces soliscabiei TaxID=588897 RepID=UPI0029A66ED6|nr:hypothetical protein [Streptomyces sp. NY05-11A]MDX2679274.1 hypothetical protein [Streptomyces sp. NY05-11A]
MDHQNLSAPACAQISTPEPSDLDVAIGVAQQLLDSDSILSMREALRLLLRALDAEPGGGNAPSTLTVADLPQSKCTDSNEAYTPIGPGCGAPATVSFEGYSPRDGLAHGSLDVIVHACDEHTSKARDEWLGTLMPYRTTPGTTSRCGESFDFTTLRGGQ